MSERKTVLVTGSSRGLGRAMALAFGQHGYDVAVHYGRSSGPAEEVAAQLEGLGVQSALFQADIADANACTDLMKAVSKTLGPVSVLVNNAGITRDGLAMRMKPEQWDKVIQTNLSSAFHLSKAALRPMLSQKWGRIINISSVAGLQGNAGQVNYASAKAGLIGLTKSLAEEYGGKGLTVNAIAPGVIESDMTAVLSEEVKAAYLGRIPVGRFGKPEEIAYTAVFLASESAAYINGQTLAVDGGLTMH